MTKEAAEAVGARLEQQFRTIHQTAMLDTPLCNDALQVQAIGFRPYDGQALGIVVTPWFMNLVLAPLPGHDFPEGRVGDRRPLKLPAGQVDFMIGELVGFGRLDSCSLFSPVFDFADHKTAGDTAAAVIEALFAVPQQQQGAPGVSRRNLLRGKMGAVP